MPNESRPDAVRLAAIPVDECGEHLVDIAVAAPLLAADPAIGPPGTYLRSSVVDRLVVAQSLLPRQLRLLILTCHDTRCRDESQAVTLEMGASHRTGGAVDVTVVDAAGDWSAGPPHSGQQDLLSTALRASGMVGRSSRWFHWSYGDRYWAYETNAESARYDVITRD